jgi:Niemann-Pick C1 protein
MCRGPTKSEADVAAAAAMNTDNKNSSNGCERCVESFGDTVDGGISSFFKIIGLWVGQNPRKTIGACLVLTVLCGFGFMRWETENRGDFLWVPQDTLGAQETAMYQSYFGSNARINTMIVQNKQLGENVLTKELLVSAMEMSGVITTEQTTVEGESYDFVDLCVKAGGSCADFSTEGVCQCLITSILKQWNYDLATLEADDDVIQTINMYGSQSDLEAVLGNPVFINNTLVSAEAFVLSYFLESQSFVEDGTEVDPINEGWEKDVFLETAQSVPQTWPDLLVDYFSTRSFGDEFGGEISGDLFYVQISYIMAFLFVGASLGRIKCGLGSRWTLSLAVVATVGLSTAAGMGFSSLCGLFYGPVHSILPFILLGVGVDDSFVIANGFDRERRIGRREDEDNVTLAGRASRALARAGSSITVTSMTDFVAFAISASSALPALASFCAYAAISIFFLWLFSATFFTGSMVLDERRQRDNRRECVCCLSRKNQTEDDVFQEGFVSRNIRNYYAPAILSRWGKPVVLLFFASLFSFGIFGTVNLSVEDTEREFIPAQSYLTSYFDAFDTYFPTDGIDLFITFESGPQIYESRQELAELATRLTGLESEPPYIAEPTSEQTYRNVMDGLYNYLVENGSASIGGAALGDDSWPTTEEDFYATLSTYTSFNGPGAVYAQDVVFADDGTLDAYRVQSKYVRLTKEDRSGRVIDDAGRQIDAMDATREMIASWTDLQPAFPYSAKFTTIEGFKVIQQELFQNVGLALVAVAIIIFVTVASPMTALLITLNVAFCLCEILGFMWLLGFAIDSVSVINLVLAVGLSVDYSAHIGHCFMVKGGTDKNQRSIEALADMGAAVLAGGTSTFLAVVVLLFSNSYVFFVLSRQFCLTVVLGLAHGLILLPVMLSILGPKPFSSAETPDADKKALPKNGEDDEGDIEVIKAMQHTETVPIDRSTHTDSPAEDEVEDDGTEKEKKKKKKKKSKSKKSLKEGEEDGVGESNTKDEDKEP